MINRYQTAETHLHRRVTQRALGLQRVVIESEIRRLHGRLFVHLVDWRCATGSEPTSFAATG